MSLGDTPGLYELLVTGSVGEELDSLSDLEIERATIDPADQPHVLARHLYDEAVRTFASIGDEQERLDLVNDLLQRLSTPFDAVRAPASQLLRIASEPGPGTSPRYLGRPTTPLAQSALLTN